MSSLNFDAEKLMQSQRGNDCKVIAIGAVLNWLHENKKITQPPLPARFRHEKAKKPKPKDGQLYSLRQVAKQKLAEKYGGEAKDQVTESIDDPEILAQVARVHSEVTADFIDCKSEAHYLDIIQQAIDKGLAPIVFFDVHSRTEQPGIFAGTHEHSAIVIGHTQGGMSENGFANRTFFTLAQWGDKMANVDSRALFRSSQQLRSEHATESYYRYPERKEEPNKGRGWIPVSQITDPKLEFLRSTDRFKEARAVRPGEAQPDLSLQGPLGSKGYPKRQAPASIDNHGGLRRKVLLIGSKQHHNHIIAGLKSLKPLATSHPENLPWYWQDYRWKYKKDRGWVPESYLGEVPNPKIELLRTSDHFEETKAVQPDKAQLIAEPKSLIPLTISRPSPSPAALHFAEPKSLKPLATSRPSPSPAALHWFWQACLGLAGLCSLYAIAHSAAALILKTTALGLATFTASWVLFVAIVALAMVLIAAAHCRMDKADLPKIRPEFHPTQISKPELGEPYSPHHSPAPPFLSPAAIITPTSSR